MVCIAKNGVAHQEQRVQKRLRLSLSRRNSTPSPFSRPQLVLTNRWLDFPQTCCAFVKPSGHIVEIPLRAGPSPCPACLSKQHKLDAIREENLDLPRNHTGKRVRKRLLAFFQYTGLPVLAGMRKLLSYGTTTASTVTWTRTRLRISTADRGSAEHQSHTTKLNATTVSRH